MNDTLQTAATRLPDILFYVFAGVALVGATQVLSRRNPMNAAVSMVVTVLSIAMLYLLLSAHFIAAAQMIVYAGAIVVLFIFVIMLLNLTEAELGKHRFSLFKTFGALVALGVLTAVSPAVRTIFGVPMPAETASGYGATKTVGQLLFGEFLLPFEVTSVLILAAMVAGVVLAKKDLRPKRVFSLVDALLDRFVKK